MSYTHGYFVTPPDLGSFSLLDVVDVLVPGQNAAKHRTEKFGNSGPPSLFVTSRRNFVAKTKP